MLARFVLSALIVLLPSFAVAQSIRVGVVVDRTGPGASSAVDAVLDAFETRLASAGGVFGMEFDVIVRDGRSDPSRVRAELLDLVRVEGVHALVCCASATSARVAEEVAAEHGVLTLVLDAAPGSGGGWLFGLGPDERTELRAMVSHAYAEGKHALALMTLDNAFGDRAAEALEEELGVAGMELLVTERYPPDVAVLTPQALWVATRQPGAVIVWGLSQDTEVAVDALRRRGYEGPIYARGTVLGDPSAGMGAGEFRNVRFPVAPIRVDDAAAGATGALEAAVALADYLRGLYGLTDVSAVAARAYDGLDLLRDAAEQAALYGVSPDDVPGYRVALRDAAIALPEWFGAGGTYELEDRGGSAAVPGGLVIVDVRDGRRLAVVP